MMHIRNTHSRELKEIHEMSYQNHVGNFLSDKSFETHENDFHGDKIIYQSIISSSGTLAGYIIILNENKAKTVQLKRVLIDEKHLGIGQEAILSIENYCVRELKSNRIWLDVYEDNSKAIHVYEKLGYVKFKKEIQNAKSVMFYEKNL